MRFTWLFLLCSCQFDPSGLTETGVPSSDDAGKSDALDPSDARSDARPDAGRPDAALPDAAVCPGFTAYATGFYQKNTNLLAWGYAEDFCETEGAHLATITSAEENTVLKGLTNGDTVWIGLTDAEIEGQFRWVTGETFNFVDWDMNEPNDFSPGEDCVSMRSNGHWNDQSCLSVINAFACECDE